MSAVILPSPLCSHNLEAAWTRHVKQTEGFSFLFREHWVGIRWSWSGIWWIRDGLGPAQEVDLGIGRLLVRSPAPHSVLLLGVEVSLSETLT